MENLTLVNKAILETLYLWQRSEWRYYKAIQMAFKNRTSEEYLIQFAENEYYRFLNEYKIRRSLTGKGKPPVVKLVKDMFKKDGFAEKVINFETNQNIIDEYCKELSNKKEISGGKKLLSLLTKTSFILKPNVVPLFDKYAKESLKQETGIKIEDFKSFFQAFNKFKNDNIDSVRENVDKYSCVFENFNELSEFKDNKEFIAHRTIDKILWLKYSLNRKKT